MAIMKKSDIMSDNTLKLYEETIKLIEEMPPIILPKYKKTNLKIKCHYCGAPKIKNRECEYCGL